MKDRETLRRESKDRRSKFTSDVVDKMSQLATSAFGLVAALAWNGAIQAVFATYYAPGDKGAIWPLLGYAALVTLIAVLVSLWISRVAARLKGHAQAASQA